MFVTVVGTAILTVPALPEIIAGLVPTAPEGGLLYTLGLIGGVGGTITMAAYGYWLHAKGWRDASWMRVMRMDNSVAYITTGVFVVSMMIVGTELLFAANIAVEGEEGLLNVGTVLGNEFGPFMRWMFLVGFWANRFN